MDTDRVFFLWFIKQTKGIGTVKLNPAEFVIHMFGGVRATARALEKTPSTISKWQHENEGRIPTKNILSILVKSKELKLDITADDLIHGRELQIDEFLKR